MLQPGTRVDRYVVQHLLGRGGMASVYAVRHSVLGTAHALKVLHGRDATQRARLVREGRLQARLDPVYVVPVTDVLDVDGSPALLMPLVEGCTLAQLLRDHRPSEPDIAAMFTSIVAGVACAHAAGVVHRDLKPANVLLEVKRGAVQVRVADFGIARPEDDEPEHTREGAFVGTPAYAAPEQFTHGATVDHRADLWALGVILYELLVGQRPFHDDSRAGLARAASRGAWDRRPIPARWLPVITTLLQPDRGGRLDSATALAANVAAVVPPAALVVGGPVAEVVRRRVEAAREPAHTVAVPAAETLDPRQATDVSPRRHNLPSQRDPFVGRGADLAALQALLEGGARLVSVLGVGGTGKTRLVLQHAWQHLEEWPGGVWFCDVSEARDLGGIASALGVALDVPLGTADPVHQLGHVLAARGRCLVVLDNFEQVSRHAAETVGAWLDRAEEARLVVTTREVLGLPGEQALALAPLGDIEAVELFVTRAVAAKRDFVLTEEDRPHVRALVKLLDGLPLAIELAAARVRLMPPRSLLVRMNHRFRLLTSTGGRRDRQATLRGALDWSWELLTSGEQSALAQLSVFEGGFTLDAAEGVLALAEVWPMDAVQALVDKSLVRRAGEDRFDLLVSVQEYAAEWLATLGGDAAAGGRHAAWFAGLGAPEALDALDRHGGVGLRRALALEIDNLVVACRRSCERGDGAVAVALLRAAWAVLRLRGPLALAAELATSVLALEALTGDDRGAAECVAGEALDALGKGGQAQLQFEAALARQAAGGARRQEGVLRGQLGNLFRHQGLPEDARGHYEAALALARETGDRVHEGSVLGNLGLVQVDQGRPDEARARYQEALAIHREVGNRRAEGIVHGNLGSLDWGQGRLEQARVHFEAALAAAREVGSRRSESVALGNLGSVAWSQGHPEDARARFEAALAVAREVGDRRSEAMWRGNLGGAAAQRGDTEAARAHFEAALAVVCEVGDRRSEVHARYDLGSLLAELGPVGEARTHLEVSVALAREVGDRASEQAAQERLARLSGVTS